MASNSRTASGRRRFPVSGPLHPASRPPPSPAHQGESVSTAQKRGIWATSSTATTHSQPTIGVSMNSAQGSEYLPGAWASSDADTSGESSVSTGNRTGPNLSAALWSAQRVVGSYRQQPPSSDDAIDDGPEEGPPTKRRRGLGGAILQTALDAAIYTSAAALTAFSVWKTWGEKAVGDEIGGVEEKAAAKEREETEKAQGDELGGPGPPPPYDSLDHNPLAGPSRRTNTPARTVHVSRRRRRPTFDRVGRHPHRPSRSSPEHPSRSLGSKAGRASAGPAANGLDDDGDDDDEMYKRFGDTLAGLIAEGKKALEAKADISDYDDDQDMALEVSDSRQAEGIESTGSDWVDLGGRTGGPFTQSNSHPNVTPFTFMAPPHPTLASAGRSFAPQGGPAPLASQNDPDGQGWSRAASSVLPEPTKFARPPGSLAFGPRRDNVSSSKGPLHWTEGGAAGNSSGSFSTSPRGIGPGSWNDRAPSAAQTSFDFGYGSSAGGVGAATSSPFTFGAPNAKARPYARPSVLDTSFGGSTARTAGSAAPFGSPNFSSSPKRAQTESERRLSATLGARTAGALASSDSCRAEGTSPSARTQGLKRTVGFETGLSSSASTPSRLGSPSSTGARSGRATAGPPPTSPRRSGFGMGNGTPTRPRWN